MSAFAPAVLLSPTFTAGMVLSLSLIMAIGPQNAHVLRMGLQRQHLWLTVAVCVVADVALIGLGVLGLAQLGGLSDKLQGALVGAGVLFLLVYGWQAARRVWRPVAAPVGATAPAASPATPGAPTPLTRRQAVATAVAQPPRLVGHRGADRHRLVGLRHPRQHRVWCRRGRGVGGVVPGLGRCGVLAGPAHRFGGRVAGRGRRGGLDDVGNGGVVGGGVVLI